MNLLRLRPWKLAYPAAATNTQFRTMKAWALGGPEQLSLVDKPAPGSAELLVRARDRVDDTIKVVVQNRFA